jgi:hypothetical protein
MDTEQKETHRQQRNLSPPGGWCEGLIDHEVFCVSHIAIIPRWRLVHLRFLRVRLFGDDISELIVCNVLFLDFQMIFISPHLLYFIGKQALRKTGQLYT